MTYYTLVTRDDQDAPWYPQFGDYDRASALQERRDSYANVRGVNWRIIKTDDAWDAIDNEIKALNTVADHCDALC